MAFNGLSQKQSSPTSRRDNGSPAPSEKTETGTLKKSAEITRGVCSKFKPQQWRKDTCSECFHKKLEHAGVRDLDMKIIFNQKEPSYRTPDRRRSHRNVRPIGNAWFWYPVQSLWHKLFF